MDNFEPFEFRIERRRRAAPRDAHLDDPILFDIEQGFCAYIGDLLSKQLGPAYSIKPRPKDPNTELPTTAAGVEVSVPTTNEHLVRFDPPTRLTSTGCWCPNPAKPTHHYWRTCTRFVPQPIIAPNAGPVACCPHPPEAPTSNTSKFIYDPASPPSAAAISHLFCFDPRNAASVYMRWFVVIPGPPDSPPSLEDVDYLGSWLLDCYYTEDHYRRNGVANPWLPQRGPDGRPVYHPRWEELPVSDDVARAHMALLSRLFVDLRGAPPKSSRAGCWYDAERVHAIVRWGIKTIRKTMDEMLPFVVKAKAERIARQEKIDAEKRRVEEQDRLARESVLETERTEWNQRGGGTFYG